MLWIFTFVVFDGVVFSIENQESFQFFFLIFFYSRGGGTYWQKIFIFQLWQIFLKLVFLCQFNILSISAPKINIWGTNEHPSCSKTGGLFLFLNLNLYIPFMKYIVEYKLKLVQDDSWIPLDDC
jgi:hypothetical protein